MKYNCKKLSVLFAAVMMFVLACPVTVLAAAEEEAGTPAVYATFWSLIPPVVAIILALITKEVYSSLFLGILVGALLYSGGNFEGTVNHIFSGGMISVLSSVFFSCERLFCGVYPAKASLIFASFTPKKRPMVMAASALGKLYSPISCV